MQLDFINQSYISLYFMFFFVPEASCQSTPNHAHACLPTTNFRLSPAFYIYNLLFGRKVAPFEMSLLTYLLTYLRQ